MRECDKYRERDLTGEAEKGKRVLAGDGASSGGHCEEARYCTSLYVCPALPGGCRSRGGRLNPMHRPRPAQSSPAQSVPVQLSPALRGPASCTYSISIPSHYLHFIIPFQPLHLHLSTSFHFWCYLQYSRLPRFPLFGNCRTSVEPLPAHSFEP